MSGRQPVSLEVRFWEKVDVRECDECWPWTANWDRTHGYGLIKMTYTPGVAEQAHAHRVSWEIANHKRVPRGLDVMHSCDNRICVNPKHLSVGTRKQNLEDMVAKGRSNKNEKHPFAKLSNRQVVVLRNLYGTRRYTQQRLSVMFRVTQQQVCRIVTHKQREQ
jgi:hypothetical protein